MGVMHSVVPLLWALVFLGMLTLVFAVVLLHGVTTYLSGAAKGDRLAEALAVYFSSLPMTVLSMFMSVTGGVNWWEIGSVLMDMSPFHACVFIVYVSVMILGVLNIITGIFVNDAIEMAQTDRDLMSQVHHQRTKNIVGELRKLFHELDTDLSGKLTFSEFRRSLDDQKMLFCFAALGIEVSDAMSFFQLLDVDGTDEIEIEEFIVGCMNYRGLAKTVDVETLMREQKRLLKRWEKKAKETRQQLVDLGLQVSDIQNSMVQSIANVKMV